MASPSASPAITKHDLETRLIEKCWKDPEFRRQVLADPKGTFEKQLGRLPADLKILIHEDSANTLNFTLPPTPSNSAELSDEELEKVAGGTEVIAATVALSVVTALSAAVGIQYGVKQGGW